MRILLAALRCVGALMLLPVLGGCSASKFIDLYAADYRDTAANAGDAQLLQNILRAKDNLPIHFADLSIIHGSIQLTAGSGSSLPFAHFAGSQTPSQVNPTFTAQSAPSFDIGTLDTQDFTKGILKPINVQIIDQLFAQGVDPRIIMMLFFSQYKTPDGRVHLNNMACDYSRPLSKTGDCWSHIYDFLHEINSIFRRQQPRHFRPGQAGILARRAPLHANIYVELTPVGAPLTGPWTVADSLGDLSGIDSNKYRLEGRQLYSISDPEIAICYYASDLRLYPLFKTRAGKAACDQDEVKVLNSPDRSSGLSIRSTYEILQFLGQVLRFQEEHGNNRCLTLDEFDTSCDKGDVLFQVNAPVGTPVVSTRYNGERYTIHDRGCTKIKEEVCDYSLEVFAILELLLNANKAATDIPSTPRVQVVR